MYWKISILSVFLVCMFGCLSYGQPTEPLDSSDAPVGTVEIGEAEIMDNALPEGCVATLAELPEHYSYQKTNPYLQSNHVIVVLKEARRLMLFQDGEIRHDRADGAPDCWKIALGVYSDGRPSYAFDKSFEGDRHTPVGFFRVSDKPWSDYHGAMLIHYPSSRHAQQAYNGGRVKKNVVDAVAKATLNGTAPPQNTPMGGDILIHGGGSWRDWTWGCIALNDYDIDELRSFLPDGMKTWVLILP